MYGLGRVFNVTGPAMDGVWVNLKDARAVTFVCYLAGGVGDTYTLHEAQDASSTGDQALACITEWHVNTGNASDAWVKHTQTAADHIDTDAAADHNCAVFTVNASQLSDTYTHVKVTSTGNGVVTAITHDLLVQRAPANLAILGA